MTAHRHKNAAGKWVNPSQDGAHAHPEYVTKEELKAALDALTPPPVVVPPVVVPPVTPPEITPIYTPVPWTSTALAAAINGAGPGTELWLEGDYLFPAMKYIGGTDIKVRPVPGKIARLVGQGQSTLLYADVTRGVRPAVRIVFEGISWIGADVLQGDSNGSSLLGWGPGSVECGTLACDFAGSPKWTGNTQHLTYYFGAAGQPVGRGHFSHGDIYDGRGMKGEMVAVYHPTAVDGLLISGGSFYAAEKGVQVYDTPSKGIVIDGCAFTDVKWGIRHKYGSGTTVRNCRRVGTGTLWLNDAETAAEKAAFVDGGGNVR